jgi:hypothetical protein
MLRVLRPGIGLLLRVPDVEHHKLATWLGQQIYTFETGLA